MIKTLTISGFRGISQGVPFELGAVTSFRPKRPGKTTVFDAIDWCLFGASWRLGFDAESIRNIYYPNLTPLVRMEMRLPDKTLLIERTAASAFLNGSRISDRDLVETLMTDPGGIAPYTRDVEVAPAYRLSVTTRHQSSRSPRQRVRTDIAIPSTVRGSKRLRDAVRSTAN